MNEFDLPRERKVGHLTLLRSARTLTSGELNLLPFEDRLAVVRGAAGRQKYQLLLDARDAERLVRSLPAQEVYLLIKELGSADMGDLLPLVDTGQLTAFLDLDSWQGDLLDGRGALEWLALVAEGGEERGLELLQELDFELLTLILQKLVTVLRGPEDYLDEDARLEASQHNGGYELAFLDSESAKQVGALLELLLRRDPDLFFRLMTAVRWEQGAILEEENFRQRNQRLQDLGFPDPAEARGIYAWLDPALFEPAEWRRSGIPALPDGEAPAFMLSAASPRHLLAEVLAAGIDPETAWELTFVLNRVMSADGVDVGSLERVQEATGDVYRCLNLALEHLCGSDVEAAARLFGHHYLQPLFRLGFSLTLALQRRARRLQESVIAPYLDGPFRSLVDALLLKKPRLYEGVENPTRGGVRPFSTLGDLRLVEQWLDRLEVQQRLFEARLPFPLPAPGELDLAGCAPDQVEDLALSDFFLTALANRLLGRPFAPLPLAADDLLRLHARVCREGLVADDLRRETVKWLDSLEPGAGPFAEYCLDLWQEGFCAQEPDQLDPRYLSGMIVRLR